MNRAMHKMPILFILMLQKKRMDEYFVKMNCCCFFQIKRCFLLVNKTMFGITVGNLNLNNSNFTQQKPKILSISHTTLI